MVGTIEFFFVMNPFTNEFNCMGAISLVENGFMTLLTFVSNRDYECLVVQNAYINMVNTFFMSISIDRVGKKTLVPFHGQHPLEMFCFTIA